MSGGVSGDEAVGGGADAPAEDAAAELVVRGRLVARWLGLSLPERTEAVAALPAEVGRAWLEGWHNWAHPGQVAPTAPWRVWLVRAGRGFGKTRAGAEWVGRVARLDGAARIALVGGTAADARRVMVEGASGVLASALPGERPEWRRSAGELCWPSGARGFVYSADAPDSLRGPQHSAAWCDELAKWRHGEAAWDNLTMGMRIGGDPRVVVTTTPRPTGLMRRVMAMADCVETAGRTRDNPHLPLAFVDGLERTYGGTRLGRQELDGELVDDVPGALWTRDLVERCRGGEPPRAVRVVVGVDPPAGTLSGDGGDACGIVAAMLGEDGRAWVLEDASVSGLSPAGWARAVAACAARHGADRVVAESNQGGAMVAEVLRAADAGLPVALTHASQSKGARAEPVALLYEAGRVRHARPFPELEDELCGLGAGGAYRGPGRSPDRADALVWAVAELMLGKRAPPTVRLLN